MRYSATSTLSLASLQVSPTACTEGPVTVRPDTAVGAVVSLKAGTRLSAT